MLTNDTAALVERNCEECGGSGVAETIAGFDRPCDACHGSGAIKWTQTEAVLLDQIEAQAATITALQARVGELEAALTDMPEPHEYLNAADLRLIRSYIDALHTWDAKPAQLAETQHD